MSSSVEIYVTILKSTDAQTLMHVGRSGIEVWVDNAAFKIVSRLPPNDARISIAEARALRKGLI